MWDRPCLWSGLSGMTLSSKALSHYFSHSKGAAQAAKPYLQKCRTAGITNCSRRKTVTSAMGQCHGLRCSEYHEDSRAWKPETEKSKQWRREVRKAKTWLFLHALEILKFYPFCADNLETNAGIQLQPTGGKRNQEYQHQFSFVVFKQFWCLSQEQEH